MNICLVKKLGSVVTELSLNDSIVDDVNYYTGGISNVELGFRQKDNIFENVQGVCVCFEAVLKKGTPNEKTLIFSRESELNRNVYIKYLYNEKKIKLSLTNSSGTEFTPDSKGYFILKDYWDGREDLMFKLKLEVEPGVVSSYSENIDLDVRVLLYQLK